MGLNTAKQVEKLQGALEDVSPDDRMAEAGRKVLLADFIKALSHEEGSRSGEDSEDVHQMRVHIRRMRSLMRFLRPYFKKKVIKQYSRDLQSVASALGDIRDLD